MTRPKADGDPPRTAYVADRVFDGERVRAHQAVIVAGQQIEQVLPAGELPPGLPRVELPGCTILPGLIDAHVHFMRWQGPLYLAYGVTTIRDVGNELSWILARRAEWLTQPWPRLQCVGPLLDGNPPLHGILARGCPDLASAQQAVREVVAAGVDGIKFYVGLPADWIPAMTLEAHLAGRKVAMHSSGVGVLGPARFGVDEFFHLDGLVADLWPNHPPGWLDLWGLPEFAQTAARQQAVADELQGLGVVMTPTLAYWDSQWRIRRPGYPQGAEARHVPDAVVASQRSPTNPDASARWARALAAAQGFVRLLVERGVLVLAGTDVPCGAVTPGLSLWHELSLLVGSGMSPVAALRAATADPARFLGLPTLGHLGPGAAADLVIVNGDPTTAIPEAPDISLVLRAGTRYVPADLLARASAAAVGLEQDPAGQQWLRR